MTELHVEIPPRISERVYYWLDEGNNKDDLIKWVWELLSPMQRRSLEEEINTACADAQEDSDD